MGREDAFLHRYRDRFGPPRNFELGNNMPDMIADREMANLDDASDLLIG